MKFFERFLHPKYEKNIPEVKLNQKEIDKKGQEAYDLELRRAVDKGLKGEEAKKIAETAKERAISEYIHKVEIVGTEKVRAAQAEKQNKSDVANGKSRNEIVANAGEYEYQKSMRELEKDGFGSSDIVKAEHERNAAMERIVDMDKERQVRFVGEKAYIRALHEAVASGLNPVDAKKHAEEERKNAEDVERARNTD